MRHRYLYLLLPLALCACAGAPSGKAELAALETGLTVADTAALAYLELPACARGGPQICRDVAIAAGVVGASRGAYSALASLRADLAAGKPAGVVSVDLIRAQEALSAFQTTLSNLPAKGA